MTAHPLQAAPRQHLLALGLSALVTAGVLAGLLGLAGSDSAAQLAQQRLQRQQAVAPPAVSPAPLMPST
jgi:hydroxymethylglutaryl-CoA reductase